MTCSIPMLAQSIGYRVFDERHVSTPADLRGLYIANEDQDAAFNAVGPTIEPLLQLNENVRVEVWPATSFSHFLDQMKGKASRLCEKVGAGDVETGGEGLSC